ncbi:uncharacterized protein LOC134818601 isoform X2 [Bolinopsis microptera]|uniref:uncharacterized protein LOC134818601 isoform X2 n=1 Tax=Bolinopsis microptera TaxID=2820187 RepID=UPI003079C17E
MGITCCRKTAKDIIKAAGNDCSMLIKKVVEFGEATHDDAVEDALTLLDELMDEQYLYMGRNNLPHRMIYNETGGVSIVYEQEAETLANTTNPQQPAVDLIGDNFNREIGNARWGKNESIDVFHIAGICRQVRAPTNLSRTDPEIQLDQMEVKHLCPSSSDLNKFSEQAVDLVMIVLSRRDDDLSFCRGWIDPHIKHPLRKTMDQATVTVPLGIIPENQTSTAANVRILNECEQYMNKKNLTFFYGDYLTRERLQGAKISLSSVPDLLLHSTVEADGNFHTLIVLLTSIMKLIHSEESKLEKATFTGTCYSLGNSKAATTNVKASYIKTRNAFMIYFEAVLHSAWLKMLEDYPIIKEELESARKTGRIAFLERFRSDVTKLLKRLLQFDEKHWIDNRKPLPCRFCQDKFTNRGLIRRHLMEKHCDTEKAAETIIKGDFGHLFEDDEMFNYGRLVIYLGLLFTNLEKSISYGDGERETLCLKLTIPIFRRMGRTKYAHSMVRRVVMLKSLLSEAEAYEYRHNTTVETMSTTANALAYLYTIKKTVEDEIRGIKRKKNKKAEITGTYEKVLGQVKWGAFFKFTPDRKSPAGLSIKKNIHYDNKSKKTLTNWLGDSLTRYQKTYSKFKTCAEINLIDPIDDPDEDVDEVVSSPPEGEEDKSDDDDDNLEEREEFLVQFADFVSSVSETG